MMTPDGSHYGQGREAEFTQWCTQRWPRLIAAPLIHAMKYMVRAGVKTEDAKADLVKARWWIDRAIKLIDSQGADCV
jgi:hypothetical protein